MKTIKLILLSLTLCTLVVFYVAGNDTQLEYCQTNDFECRDFYILLEGLFSWAPFFLLVASATVFLPDKYYKSWLRFAWWGGTITIGIVMFTNAGFHNTPGDLYAGLFDNAIVLVAYTFFVFGSLIQLLRVYRKSSTKK